MEFLKQCTSLEKPFLKHYFTNFLKDLSNKNLVALCGLLTTKIGKPKTKLYATLGRRAWVPQHERNKVLQLLVNQWMIRSPPKSQELWDSQKIQHANPWQENNVCSIVLCSTYNYLNCPNVEIICNQLNMDWYKMDFVDNNCNKTKGTCKKREAWGNKTLNVYCNLEV